VYATELKRYLEEGTLPPDPELLAEEKAKRNQKYHDQEAKRIQAEKEGSKDVDPQ
jgi:hypothetical protein